MARIAVVGATGLVGERFLRVLEERDFPVDDIYLFSKAKRDKEVYFKGKKYQVFTPSEIPKVDIALFSAGEETARELAPLFKKKGAVVVDNSSAFRLMPDVPLVIPEINPEDVKLHNGIIANPNCSTIIMLIPLFPLHLKWRIRRIITSTYQSVSGAGRDELERFKMGECYKDEIIPWIGKEYEDGYTKEENKMIYETRKIMHEPDIRVEATCVRVPVPWVHSLSITVEFEKYPSPEEAVEVLKESPGVKVEERKLLDIKDRDEVFVWRIRKSRVFDNGLSMWVAGDNLRKGAATNAIQIAELLIRND